MAWRTISVLSACNVSDTYLPQTHPPSVAVLLSAVIGNMSHREPCGQEGDMQTDRMTEATRHPLRRVCRPYPLRRCRTPDTESPEGLGVHREVGSAATTSFIPIMHTHTERCLCM